jgi:hypothetical protein
MSSMPPLLLFQLIVVSGCIRQNQPIVVAFPQAENGL